MYTMEFKGVLCLFLVVFITLFQNIYALPRDASVVKSDLPVPHHTNINSPKEPVKDVSSTPKVPSLPGRLPCSHEEATEDASCQEHCLPKGYSYGICVSGTCSCI